MRVSVFVFFCGLRNILLLIAPANILSSSSTWCSSILGNTKFQRDAVPSLTGRSIFQLVLILGRASMEDPLPTEEVEDTKTFLRILLLLLSLVGSHLLGHGYSLHDQLMKTQCPSYWVSFFVGDPMQFAYITVAFWNTFVSAFHFLLWQSISSKHA